jgi:hypothetical protein
LLGSIKKNEKCEKVETNSNTWKRSKNQTRVEKISKKIYIKLDEMHSTLALYNVLFSLLLGVRCYHFHTAILFYSARDVHSMKQGNCFYNNDSAKTKQQLEH